MAATGLHILAKVSVRLEPVATLPPLSCGVLLVRAGATLSTVRPVLSAAVAEVLLAVVAVTETLRPCTLSMEPAVMVY